VTDKAYNYLLISVSGIRQCLGRCSSVLLLLADGWLHFCRTSWCGPTGSVVSGWRCEDAGARRHVELLVIARCPRSQWALATACADDLTRPRAACPERVVWDRGWVINDRAAWLLVGSPLQPVVCSSMNESLLSYTVLIIVSACRLNTALLAACESAYSMYIYTYVCQDRTECTALWRGGWAIYHESVCTKPYVQYAQVDVWISRVWRFTNQFKSVWYGVFFNTACRDVMKGKSTVGQISLQFMLSVMKSRLLHAVPRSGSNTYKAANSSSTRIEWQPPISHSLFEDWLLVSSGSWCSLALCK